MAFSNTSVRPWWITRYTSEETLQNILIVLLPLFIIFSIIFSVKKQRNENPPQPPGPRGLPLVGYLPFLSSDLHHSFKELASLYGPIVKFRLGIQDCIVVNSPSLVKEVLRVHDAVFSNRVPSIAAKGLFFGSVDIAFSNNSLEWRKMRKTFCSELMSNANLDASYHLRKQHINKMLNETCRKASQLVNISELAFVTLLSSIMSMMWGDTLKGNECSAINAEFRVVLGKQMELLGALNISDIFPFLARFDLQGIDKKMKEMSICCEQILDSAIKRHKAQENVKGKDFLGQLLELTQYEEPTSLTLPQVKAILMDVVIAGAHTTVTFLEWAMAEILKHPEVQEKVQEELAEIVGLNAAVEEAHLHKLKYLNAVAKETLRLHPVVPLLVPHCPSEPSIIGGYSVPKGSRVFLNVYTIQRDPLLWENPLLFNPERFLSGSAADKTYLGNDFEFLPFGSGRRACPGIPLAERMSLLALASLLHAFEWKLPNGTVDVDLSEKFGMIMKLQKPLIAVPSLRLSSLELYSYND